MKTWREIFMLIGLSALAFVGMYLSEGETRVLLFGVTIWCARTANLWRERRGWAIERTELRKQQGSVQPDRFGPATRSYTSSWRSN